MVEVYVYLSALNILWSVMNVDIINTNIIAVLIGTVSGKTNYGRDFQTVFRDPFTCRDTQFDHPQRYTSAKY